VTDLIDGLDRLMNSPEEVTGPINIGNPGEFTIRELAEKILVATGSKSKLVELPLPEDDPKQRQPNIERAGALLGWRPTVNLDEGLRRTIGYFETLLREHGKSIVSSRTAQSAAV
jgi:UDP-glucuronate decarboxylase